MNACKAPQTSNELKAYYYLRWQKLRKNWGQALGSELDEHESQAFHRMIIDDQGQILAIGRLHQIDQYHGQIRYMASAPAVRGMGYARVILQQLENICIR